MIAAFTNVRDFLGLRLATNAISDALIAFLTGEAYCPTLHTYRIRTRDDNMSGRKDFLSQQAPENYVAGLGRGATGFTTRSDLGPAREGPSEDQIKEALAKRAAQLGNAPPTAYGVGKKKDDEAEEDQFQDAENEEGLFATGNYDRDDDEADRIYQTVDERMDRRRKARRLVYPNLLSLPSSLCNH